MFRKQKSVLTAMLLSLAITGCGGSESGDGDSSGSDGDNSSGGGSTDGTDAAFFNDQETFSFANSVGGRLSSLFANAYGVLSSSTDSAKRQVQAEQTSSFPCEDSGDIALTYVVNDATFELTSVVLGFSECVEEGDTTNGSIAISGSAFTSLDGSGDLVVDLDNLAVSGADPVSMDGTVTATMSAAGDETTVGVSGNNLSMVAENETINFTNYVLTVINNETTGGTSVALTATIDSSIDGEVAVVIDPPFVRDDDQDAPPTAGRMVMTHADGSSLTIDADTGNEATFNYTVNEDGTVTTGTANWVDTDLDFS